MLKPKVLTDVLKQANTNGVKTTLLLSSDGSLLAAAGDENWFVSAIFANIWTSYERSDGSLEYLINDNEEGRVVMTKVTESLVLLIGGDKTAEFGMLKHKAKLLKEYLAEPLKQLME